MGSGELSVVIPGVIAPGLLTFSGGSIEDDLDDLSAPYSAEECEHSLKIRKQTYWTFW